MSPAPDPSRSRQEVVRLRDEFVRLIEVFLERSPLWRGTVYRMGRKCGRAQCRCARGDLHFSLVLTDRTLGPQQTLVPRPHHVAPLRQMTGDYQRVRHARARLTKLLRRMLAVVDHLEEERRRRGQRRLPLVDLLSEKQKLRAAAASRRRRRPP